MTAVCVEFAFERMKNMAHQDKGKYFKKHPEGTAVSEALKQDILKAAQEGNISCKAAEKIAAEKTRDLKEIGIAVDMLNINIVQCQLGLFGFDGNQKRVPPADSVAPDLEAAIRGVLVNDRLACGAAWGIAEKMKIKRLDVSAACEKLKIKIKPCQLGAF